MQFENKLIFHVDNVQVPYWQYFLAMKISDINHDVIIAIMGAAETGKAFPQI